ncbi:MAG: hypothetical protein NTZ67_04530 [Gammaproteobacteria bacterium]|nr:hypothetical protein [Gammaproteobacteria bacterium]
MTIIKIAIKIDEEEKEWLLDNEALTNASTNYLDLGIGGDEGNLRVMGFRSYHHKITQELNKDPRGINNIRDFILLICTVVFRSAFISNQFGEMILQHLNLHRNELGEIQSALEITDEACGKLEAILRMPLDKDGIVSAIGNKNNIRAAPFFKRLVNFLERYPFQAERPCNEKKATINLLEKLNQLQRSETPNALTPISLLSDPEYERSNIIDQAKVNQMIATYMLALFKVTSSSFQNTLLSNMGVTHDALIVIEKAYRDILSNENDSYVLQNSIDLSAALTADIEKKYSMLLFKNYPHIIPKQFTASLYAVKYYLSECADSIGKFGKHDRAGYIRASHLEFFLLAMKLKLESHTPESNPLTMHHDDSKEFYTLIFALVFKSGSTDLKTRIIWALGLNEYQLKNLQTELKVEDAAILHCAEKLNKSFMPINNVEWIAFKKKLVLGVNNYRSTHSGGKAGKTRANHFNAALNNIKFENSVTIGQDEGRDLLKLIYLLILHTNLNFKKKFRDCLLNEILWTVNQVKTLPDFYPLLCGDFRNLSKADADKIFTDWKPKRDASNFLLAKEEEQIQISKCDIEKLKEQLLLAITAFQKSDLGNNEEKVIAHNLKMKINALIEISSHEERATLVLYATYSIATVGVENLQEAILDFISVAPLKIEKKELHTLRQQYGLPNSCYRELKEILIEKHTSSTRKPRECLDERELEDAGINPSSVRSCHQELNDEDQAQENVERFSVGMSVAADRYLITERGGISGVGEMRAYYLKKSIGEVTHSSLSAIEKETLLIHIMLAVVLYAEPKSTVLRNKILTHVGISLSSVSALEVKYPHSKQTAIQIQKKLISWDELSFQQPFFTHNPPSLAEFQMSMPINLNRSVFWRTSTAPQCDIIANHNQFKKAILDAVSIYLIGNEEGVKTIYTAINNNISFDKKLTGVLKSLILIEMINQIGNTNNLIEKKKLILFACSFVLFAKSIGLKDKIIAQTNITEPQFQELKNAWGLSESECKNQAAAFEKRETLQKIVADKNAGLMHLQALAASVALR